MKIDIELRSTSVGLKSESWNELNVVLHNVDTSNMMEHLDESDVIGHFGTDALLDEIGMNEAIKHFGFTDIIDEIGVDQCIKHFGIEEFLIRK